jgi:hypothetical protein
MAIYELAILGDVAPAERQRLSATIAEMVGQFDLNLGREVIIRDGTSIHQRDIRAATVAAYFGGNDHSDIESTTELVRASQPVIPTVSAGADFSTAIPDFLQGFNGLRRTTADAEMKELASAMLECVGLLRKQRRVFVSYRRIESRSAALQLHDLLSARGFEVFLDTHDIRPGDPFQDILWHRLCDSDVMVMLDTPTYFESKWTRQELGRARAKEINILRIVWPEHTPTNLIEGDTVYLNSAELEGPCGPIASGMADRIMLAVEDLRSRSIASRYMTITGKLRADVLRIGATIEGVGAHRSVSIRLLDDKKIWAYPVVGIPTAEMLNDVALKASKADQHEKPVLIYDQLGIRDVWIAHLKWLDDNISSVRAIKVSEAGWRLAAWEE